MENSDEEFEDDNEEDDNEDAYSDDLEFMLYSQLHYEQSDNTIGDSGISQEYTTEEHSIVGKSQHTSVSSPGHGIEKKISVPSPEHCTEKKTSPSPVLTFPHGAIQHLMHKETFTSGKKRSSDSYDIINIESKRQKLNPKSCDDPIVISSSETSSDDDVEIVSVKGKRKETVIVETDSTMSNDDSSSSDSDSESLGGSTSSTSISPDSKVRAETPLVQAHVHAEHARLPARKGDEGNHDSHEERWYINDEDRAGAVSMARGSRRGGFGGMGPAGRYYRPSTVRCANCCEMGHLSKDCSRPRKSQICILCGFTGHNSRGCPNALCFNCSRPGHTSKECTERWQSWYERCDRCQMLGHSVQTCPDFWRQFHLTTKRQTTPTRGKSSKENRNPRSCCYNCGSKNHFGHDCRKQRVEKHSMATYPFIAKYDKKKALKHLFSEGKRRTQVEAEVQKRDERLAKMKAKWKQDDAKKIRNYTNHGKVKKKEVKQRQGDVKKKKKQKQIDAMNREVKQKGGDSEKTLDDAKSVNSSKVNKAGKNKKKRKGKKDKASCIITLSETERIVKTKKKKAKNKSNSFLTKERLKEGSSKACRNTTRTNGFKLSQTVGRVQKKIQH